VLAYGSETWVLSKFDEVILGVLERKILRAIFGPTNEKGEWRIKYNHELYTLYKDIHKRWTSTPRAGFELAIPESERLQSHALECAATGIGLHSFILQLFTMTVSRVLCVGESHG